MVDIPVNKPIDWEMIGGPKCDNNAQKEVLRAIGIVEGKYVNGRGATLDILVEKMPQLFVHNASGEIVRGAAGDPILSPKLDIATITKIPVTNAKGLVVNDKSGNPQMRDHAKLSPNGQLEYPELMAAVIYAASEVVSKHKIKLSDVPLEEIVLRMPTPLSKITGDAPTFCTKGSGFKL